MTVSGSKNFELDVADYIEEAFERCGLDAKTGYDLKTAKRSMNLLFADWANRGLNQWTVAQRNFTVTQSDGEYDLNILVKSNDGKQYVLKIMREDCLQEFVDMQIQAINHLKSIELKLPFPNIIQTISGKEFIRCKDEFGNNRLLWLIKKLPGQKYVEFKRKY